MLTLFWDERGGILDHYMPKGTLTSATYADLLKNHLRPAIKSKRRGLLSAGVLLQREQCAAPDCPLNCCNNPRSVLRVSCTSAVLARHRPQLLSSLWAAQRGDGTFRSDEEVQQAVRSQPKEFFFLEVSMHFRSAGTLVWNAVETT